MARHPYHRANGALLGRASGLALAAMLVAVPALAQPAASDPAQPDAPAPAPAQAAAAAVPTSPTAPTPPADGPAADEIIVTGARAAERAAIQNKRLSLQIVESIVADDVGKLPDQNVAESVRRLPGLSVANDQGEGRYVIIRGINPNLVNVTVNGQTQPAPEPDGRQVKLDDIPSSLIAAVTISKSLTADLDANAIGGAVDIRTLSAFDRRQDFFGAAKGEYGYYKLGGYHPYEVNGQVGGKFGADRQFGAVISASYSRRKFESENLQGTTNYRVPVPANGFVVPDQFGLRDYRPDRTRVGVVANFDWQPSDEVKLFLRGTYSQYKDNETRDQNRIDNQSAFTNQTATTGTFRGRGSVLIRRREEDDKTKSVSGGGTFTVGEGKLDIAGAWSRATKKDPLRSEYNFRTGGSTLTVNYDLSQSLYIFTPDAAAFNAANYNFNSVNYDTRQAAEELWQVRADLSYPVGIGDNSEIKIGGKYLNRHKTNNRDFVTYGLTAGRTFSLSSISYVGDTGFYDGRYTFGPRIDYAAGQAFIAANPGVITLNTASSRNNSLANDYDVREKISAGYAMATLTFGRLTLIPGVRVEHTQDDAKAKLITAASTLTQGFNSFGGKHYTDVFPGLNAKFSATDRLILRAAVTTSLARPNYPDLSPFVSVDTTASPVTVTQGNPSVKPYKALNLDATAEYYLPHQGIISIGLFYKKIDDPIYTQSTLVSNGTFAGQTFALANVTQPLNASRAYVKGIEFNVSTVFDFLPSPLDGFGVSANYTIVGGHGEGLGSRAGNFPLFFQSKRVGSAQLTYEKYGISARLAYSYRSAYLDLLGSGAATDQYTDRNGQLDARIGYDVTENINVYVQGTNLADAPWRRYIGTRNQLVERERYDYSIRGGVQLKF